MKSILQKTVVKVMLAFLLFVSLSEVSAQVTLPHYEGINYTVGSGGLQTQSGWTTLNSGDDLVITASSLSYPGLQASTGNKVSFDAGGIDAAKLFTQQTTKVYYSFLLNVTALGTLNATGGYFTGFTEGTGTNFGATVWTRLDGAGYDIGISPRTTAAATQWTSGTTALNNTVLVVVSYEIVAGANNDIVNLWINPTPGASEPAATITATNGVTLPDLANLNRILIRQDGANATPFISMDELRVGTSWGDVTPSGVPAVISYTGAPSAITNVYGSISALPTSFDVSGTGIAGGILVTAPAGYSVSLSLGSGYGPTVTVPGSGTIASTPVYVSLSTTATVAGSPYSGDIVLSSAGATPVNVATVASTVTPKALTITGVFANSKVFDGNTNATLGGTAVLSGVVNGDVVTLGGTPIATFASSAVGTGIAVTVTGYTISGAGSGNYTLTQPTGLTADITSSPPPVINSPLTVSATYGTVASAYNITATQSPTSYNATGLPSGLTVNTSTGAITGTPTAVPGLYPVTISATNGSGTGNATLDYTITAKNLTVTGATADNKVYTRTTVATISGSALVGVFGSDDVTISNTGTFAVATVANGIAVTSTQTLGGADAAKYTVTLPTGLSANITPKALTISGAAALNKVFDGNTTATLTGTLSGVISPDVVTLNLSGNFASSAIGNGIAVTSTSTITGADSGNYTLTQPTGLTANITDTPIYLNQFTGTGVCPTQGNVPTVASNATGAPLTRSTITCNVTGNVFNSTTLNNTASPSATSYLEFSATASTGYALNVTSLSFFRQASASAPNQIEVRYSTDGFASSTLWTTPPLTPVTGTTITWDFTDFISPAAGTVTFRIYPYGTQRADLGAAAAAVAGTFRVDDVAIYGTVVPVATSSVVNLKLFIEGYYQGAGAMKPVKKNQNPAYPNTTDVEDITVELRNATAPYALVASTTAVLKTNGTAVCTYPTSPNGSFYIVVKMANAIDTWSGTAQAVGPSPLTFDFSSAASQAFGNNMVDVGSGVYAFYSGDIDPDHDGNIDTIDYPIWENDSNNFESGVFRTDLDGDGNVDTIDYPIWENNSNNFISVIKP